jgi:predicted acetyltransferase
MKDFVELKPELIKLYREAFGDSEAYVDYFFSQKANAGNAFYEFSENGGLASALYLFDMKISIASAPLPSGFIAGLATFIEHKNKGYASKLMQKTFEAAYSQGKYLIVLHPSSPRFYEKFNFAPLNFMKERAVAYAAGSGLKYNFQPAGINSFSQIYEIYQNFVKSFDGYAERDALSVKKRICEVFADGGSAAVIEIEDKKYYVICDENEKLIEETTLTDYDVLCKIKELDGFAAYFPDESRKNCFNMLRIINLKGFLESLNYKRGIVKEISFNIEDKFCPQNNKAFKLTIKDGRAKAVCSKRRESFKTLTIEEFSEYILFKAGEILKLKPTICFDKY